MIDKILLLKDMVLITYTHRGPFMLKPDGDPLVFLKWFLEPSVLTLDEFTKAVGHMSEDTDILTLQEEHSRIR
jgi:hypothetical protein